MTAVSTDAENCEVQQTSLVVEYDANNTIGNSQSSCDDQVSSTHLDSHFSYDVVTSSIVTVYGTYVLLL